MQDARRNATGDPKLVDVRVAGSAVAEVLDAVGGGVVVALAAHPSGGLSCARTAHACSATADGTTAEAGRALKASTANTRPLKNSAPRRAPAANGWHAQ